MSYSRDFHAHCDACGLDMSGHCDTRGLRDGYFIWCDACRTVRGVSYNAPDYEEDYESKPLSCAVCKAPAKIWDEAQQCWKCGKVVPFKWQIYFD